MNDFGDECDRVEYARRKGAKGVTLARYAIYTLVAIVLCCDGVVMLAAFIWWNEPRDPHLSHIGVLEFRAIGLIALTLPSIIGVLICCYVSAKFEPMPVARRFFLLRLAVILLLLAFTLAHRMYLAS